MRRALGLLMIGLLMSGGSYAQSAQEQQAYLQRFLMYLHWSQHLPSTDDPNFIHFIEKKSHLSTRLREQWLMQLARQHNWTLFNQYYRPSSNPSLPCERSLAHYEQSHDPEAWLPIKAQWLSGERLSPECERIFTYYQQESLINEDLVHQRIDNALKKNNITLVKTLLTSHAKVHPQEHQLFLRIVRHEQALQDLPRIPLQGALYVFGLKQLVPKHMDQAIVAWKKAPTQALLTLAQKQDFLAYVSWYKAMRDEPDNALWFAHVLPAYYTDDLLDWQIRYAILHEQWHKVLQLIEKSPQKESPMWQYWSARAYAALGQTLQSRAIYEKLAKTRHYYGFLAATRLHQALYIDDSSHALQAANLSAYAPILEHLRTLHATHHLSQASQRIDAFTSDLSPSEQYALARWVAYELNWPTKALELSQTGVLSEQLALRFPLIYQHNIHRSAQQYHIPDAFLYAMIRQESGFHTDTYSFAGAYGLMQLMPRTAQNIARQMHLPWRGRQDLLRPDNNITLGAAYLHQLATTFHTHLIFMAAAYNAGPRQVHRWLHPLRTHELDAWIETLPWVETRNYLKNIVSFYAVYQFRLNRGVELGFMIERV